MRRSFVTSTPTAAAIAAASILFSIPTFACVQLPGANGSPMLSADRKVTLSRIESQFRRMKAAQAVKNDGRSFPGVSMTGMWMTTFTSGGEVVDAGFDVWHADGTQVLNDTPPPAAGSVCLGIWTQTGDYTYQLKHPSWAYDDTNTNLVGVSYILEQVTLDPGGNSYTGTFSVEGYDLDGNHVFHIDGEIAGDRINMDPPPDAGPVQSNSVPARR